MVDKGAGKHKMNMKLWEKEPANSQKLEQRYYLSANILSYEIKSDVKTNCIINMPVDVLH